MGNCGGREKAEGAQDEPVLVRKETGAAAGNGAAAQAGDAAAAKALESAKAERVTKLFGKWDFLANGMLPLDMLDGATVNVGPRKNHVMSELRKMDLNGDGYVEQQVCLCVPPGSCPVATRWLRAAVVGALRSS